MGKLEKILARVLGIGENSITDDTSPETVENWDSFNALLLVSELEDEFNVKFTMDEVTLVKNVGDIKKVLTRYGINLEGQ